MPWHATAKASLQNHFDGEMKLEVLARHRLLNQQVHVPAVTVAHLNAAAVSNTAITPSSSLLPINALEPPQRRRPTCCHSRPCSRRRRRRAVTDAVSLLPPRLGCAAAGHSHTCAFRKLAFVCYEHSSLGLAKAKFSFPVADCQSRALGHFKPAGAIHITRASENPDIVRQK